MPYAFAACVDVESPISINGCVEYTLDGGSVGKVGATKCAFVADGRKFAKVIGCGGMEFVVAEAMFLGIVGAAKFAVEVVAVLVVICVGVESVMAPVDKFEVVGKAAIFASEVDVLVAFVVAAF